MATVTEAIQRAVELEGGKHQVNIAQARDLVKALNEALDGELYKLIRKIKVLQ